ncbi:MAG: hypothetical protein JWO90_1395 [Solirubrobacterales bacterium]|nr:hypothetical protein [Solirubrobacterales bacterium]
MADRTGLSVLTAAATLFCVVLLGLALQMRAGRDPALGAGPAPAPPEPRIVVLRRVEVRRVLPRPVADANAAAAGAPTAPGSAAASGVPAASGASSAPIAAPAPAPTAPAPAPVVSRAS